MANITPEDVSSDVFQDIEQAPSISPSLTDSTVSASPLLDTALSLVEEDTTVAQKKKKKKKPKKRSKAKAEANTKPPIEDDEPSPLVLRISRNKHWRYISSYHGPWLQLPIELLESLLALNLDPATFHSEPCVTPIPPPPRQHSFSRMRDRAYAGFGDNSPPDSPRQTLASISCPPLLAPPPGKPIPPPIDPGVFRSVATIRRLIDEASELAVRASSGMSAAALGSVRSGASPNLHSSPWALAQSLGMNPLGDTGGGRNVAMSAMRIHRLRALAVQKLAAAYRADEIASSVMVMQGGSVFEDIAERVLKVDPNDADAKYVHFFHEKIPSRQLAECTTTRVLDELIEAFPQRLELFRTRGIVRTFRDEYGAAVKDFTHALKEARALRKARSFHRNGSRSSQNKGKKKLNGQAPPNGTSEVDGYGNASEAEPLPIHSSVLPDAPEPIEPQLLFLRGAAYLQNAIYLIEEKILNLEGIRKRISAEGAAELRLCYIQNGHYGGVEIGNPDGPLGRTDGPKLQAAPAYAFLLAEALRPGAHGTPPPPAPPPDAAVLFTTYHPLLVESHFSVLIATLMLGDFSALLRAFLRAATVIDGLEGYPVFLPPRSMAQAEFVETLERLAGGRTARARYAHAHGHSNGHANGKLAIEAPPLPSPPPMETNTPVPDVFIDPLAPSTSSGPGSASGSAETEAETGSGPGTPDFDLVESLDCARVILAPVSALEKKLSSRSSSSSSSLTSVGGSGSGSSTGEKMRKKPLPISIPLHGPRVEVVLAWMAAVWLVELESVA
ncbi:hypothetical protein EDB83DRAFT_2403992 [Lactarius deliciosus]|nr:hypothetical protein EDB83DRAFT_2403992 [Lactarius deliciosus]